MSKFKVGDRVEIVALPDTNHKLGDIGIIKKHDGSDYIPWEVEVAGKHEGFYESDELKLMEKTMDNLQVGDILVDKWGNEHEVFFVNEKIVIINDGAPDKDTETYIRSHLEQEGYSLKTEEVSKLVGKTVKIVK